MGGAFATDIYLPALPDVGTSLETTPALVQLTITAFMIGSATGQLIFGPLSDRWGRWWPLVIGTSLYILSGAAAALADSIWILIVLRVIQGLGGAAGVVISKAVVADLTTGIQRARLFSILMMLFSIAPVIAPIIGGPLSEWGGWRATMWAIAAIGGIMLLSILLLPESLPAEQRRIVKLSTTFRDFWDLARNPAFLAAAMLLTSSFGVVMSWLFASSFIMQDHFGLSPTEYALIFALCSVGSFIAGFANTIALRWATPMQINAVCLSGLLLASAALLAVVLTTTSFWAFVVLLVIAFSITMPLFANATAIGISMVPSNRAGAASAFMGAVQSVLPASIAPVLGLFGSSPVPMSVSFVLCAIIAGLIYLFLRKCGADAIH